MEEVKKAFSSMRGYKKSDFEKILNEIDLNKDEQIDFAKFKTMMETIIAH